MLKPKDGADTAGLPTITLAGEQYFVPRLTMRHRIAVSLLMQSTVGPLIKRFPRLDDIKAGATFEFAEDEYLALIDVVSHGLLGLYPAATRDALLDMLIEFDELFAAWPVVLDQGMSRRHAAGEALATGNTAATTG